MKHTSGPWKIDEATDLPLAVIDDNEEGNGICEVAWDGSWSGQGAFNARLIAAAPEMYELLKKLASVNDPYKDAISILLDKIDGR